MVKKNKKIIIIGAGLSGSLLANYLSLKDYQITIYESRSDMRESGLEGGKSINLALSLRGILPLKQLGLEEEIMELAIPMRGRIIHPSSGDKNFQPYGKSSDQYINSISRNSLNIKLIDKIASKKNIELHFDSACIDLDTEGKKVRIRQKNKEFSDYGDVIIGADGAGSIVRYVLQRRGPFNYEQNFLEHGYKELRIAPSETGEHVIEKEALHIWPRKNFMLIALPNLDGSFTATLFLLRKGKNSFEELTSSSSIQDFFDTYFPDVVDKISNLISDFKLNPVGLLGTVRFEPWYYKNSILLIGDASHAIVPFYGQGMNASFEDCRIFNELFSQLGENWGELFRKFSENRKVDTDAIADLALDNFIEMRDKVANKKFLFLKKIENRLYELYPEEMVSKYSLVTFTNLPYSVAKTKGEILSNVIRKLGANVSKAEDFEYSKAREIILSEYSKLDSSS